MIESGQLQVLMALSVSSSLSEAAENLHITQSAVSQNIKAIEAKVGFAVVTRKGKKVVLTPSGARLAKIGKSHFKKLNDAVTDILEEQNRITGSLKIGTLFGIGKSWIANRLVEFSKKYPDVEVEIKLDFPDNLLNAFDGHNLDIVILPEKILPAHCEQLHLHKESCTLIFPDSEKFDITVDTDLKTICEFPLIFFEEKDPLFYHWCRSRFGSVPRNIRPKIIVNAFGQMLQAVNEGLGIAVIPTHVFRRSHYRSLIKTFGKENDIDSSEIIFVCQTDDKDSLKIKTAYDFLKDEVSRLDVE